MGKNPASQFYWGDWINDVELQSACSASRGIWINALCRMWYSKEKGRIATNIDKFPPLLGCTPEEFDVFILEVELYGFCDIKRNGAEIQIINRRMVRDERDKELTKNRQQRFRDKGGGDPDQWTSIRIKILERDDYICAYCGKKARTVDHIIPRSKGGNEDFNNLVACCSGCNRKKNNRTLEEAEMSFWKGFDQSKLQNNAKVTPPSSSSSSSSKKERKEQKKEIDYSHLQESTDKICKMLSGYFKDFNFYGWRQEQVNKRKHPEGIEECLSLLWENRKGVKKGPRPYLTQLMKIKGPNAFEREAVGEHEKRKKEELAYDGHISKLFK